MRTTATINGIDYKKGKNFKIRDNTTGNTNSKGTGKKKVVTAGKVFEFIQYDPKTKYPFAIGTKDTIYCWVTSAAFPYATYKVYFEANGGTGAPAAQTKTWGRNMIISSTKPYKRGYTFMGWAQQSNPTFLFAAGGTYTLNASATLFAQYQVNTYTVTYDGNGADGTVQDRIVYGRSYTIRNSICNRVGHKFTGWCVQRDGNGAWLEVGRTLNYTFEESIVLYAQWEPYTYWVTYDANGGYDKPGDQSKSYGRDIRLSPTTPSKAGYVFVGWSPEQDGYAAYSAGSVYSINADVTLYAVWKLANYTVRFNANGGNGSMSDQMLTYNRESKLDKNRFTRKGYRFTGWAQTPSGYKIFNDEEIVINLANRQGTIINLFATWERIKVRVHFDTATNGGSGDTILTKFAGEPLGTLPTATKRYNVFKGWYDQPVGGTQITTTDNYYEDKTVYAQFETEKTVYVLKNGKKVAGIPYIFRDGEWKKGKGTFIAGKNGEWKKGVCE